MAAFCPAQQAKRSQMSVRQSAVTQQFLSPKSCSSPSPVLQACYIVETADSFGNAINVTQELVNISASTSLQLGLDVRQLQAEDGGSFMPGLRRQNCAQPTLSLKSVHTFIEQAVGFLD